MTNGQIAQEKTAEVYGRLFTSYSERQFEESVGLFLQRHRKWALDLGFKPDWFQDKVCLDAGCGAGRYLVALSRLGAREVKGIDISPDAVRAANIRLAERNLDRVAEARVASVLDIPFGDGTFDYVISNGVIHHTPDPHRAFLELSRVVKPGGKLFLSVYGKGGLKWLTNDVFRYTVCRLVKFKTMERLFEFCGAPANKRYNILDNLYVPYCFRFKEEEIRYWLQRSGYWNVRRVKFERYDYVKFRARLIHGEGWIQIYADRRVEAALNGMEVTQSS